MDDQDFAARAVIAGKELTNSDIRSSELRRARHALAYLKRKLGNEAMRELLQSDLDRMTAQVQGWVEASAGSWQSGSTELLVPGPSAEDFHQWYVRAMADSREPELRAGHPEHFISHPFSGQIEVVENIGETLLPWRVFYRPLPAGEQFPVPWEAGYPVRFGSELVDANELRVGFTMHQLRDDEEGMHLKLTTFLPAAAPPDLAQRHLHHFTIEFRNWAWTAWAENRAAEGGTQKNTESGHPDE